MLVQFTVENFLSFRKAATLSMVAANDPTLPHNVWVSPSGKGPDLLRSVAVFGANASGKSNLLRALWFMEWFVLNSVREGNGDTPIPIRPFKLDKACRRRPSTFEVVFLWEDVRYVFGFSVDSERVHKEWLISYPVRQPRLLYERRAAKRDIKFGSGWQGQRKVLENATRPNALFISVAAQLNNPLAEIVQGWFADKLRTVSWFPTFGTEQVFTSQLVKEEVRQQKVDILQFLRAADPGITDVLVEKRLLRESRQFTRMPDSLRKAVLSGLPKDAEMFDVSTRHEGVGTDGASTTVPFDLEEESDGTQKFYALAGPWTYVLEHGCTVVVDELDARLHPLLTMWLISLFHNPKTNPHGAQLIFATHDENLMDRGVFRRDQLWFTEKDTAGGTSLYSLSDFKGLRKEENTRKAYLAGRYGAVPYVEPTVQ